MTVLPLPLSYFFQKVYEKLSKSVDNAVLREFFVYTLIKNRVKTLILLSAKRRTLAMYKASIVILPKLCL